MTLDDALRADLARFSRADSVLVAVDFDGTLAPFVHDPAAARPLAGGARALARLQALPDTTVALVSGRPLADLTQLADAPAGSILIGSHGAETSSPDGGRHTLATGDERARIDRLERRIAGIVDGYDGAFVERKPFGLGLHTRALARADEDEAQAAVRAVLAADPGPPLTVRDGKHILEFAVRTTTKGEALRAVREDAGAGAVFFAGDDVTDEDGFAALVDGDVGVKVGPGDTIATHRVASPDAFVHVLDALADERSRARG